MFKKTLEYIIKSLVEKPESVFVKETKEDGKYTLTLKVDDKDIGKVIGKDGKTIRALRTIVTLFSDEKEVAVDVEQ